MVNKPIRDPSQHFVYPPILQAACDLRHPLTPTERQLWTRVRNRQLGHKIRRQHPIFRFIADFFCAEAMLVIEIDGDSHGEPKQAKYDALRTEWLEAHGSLLESSRLDRTRKPPHGASARRVSRRRQGRTAARGYRT